MVSTLILGAGINGLFSAFMLRKAGLEVHLLDQGDTGKESSWAGAGILSLLLPWHYDANINALAQRGRALWPSAATRLGTASGINPEYWRCGMLVLDPDHREAALNWCGAHNETLDRLPLDLRAKFPCVLCFLSIIRLRHKLFGFTHKFLPA
mgnify:CR=1 FL=1